jgi:hypothetical protein
VYRFRVTSRRAIETDGVFSLEPAGTLHFHTAADLSDQVRPSVM